jgi:hypothetical protein
VTLSRGRAIQSRGLPGTARRNPGPRLLRMVLRVRLEKRLRPRPIFRSVCKRVPLAQVWRAIEVGGKAAWLPILIVSSFGLYYNCGNYGIQSRTARRRENCRCKHGCAVRRPFGPSFSVVSRVHKQRQTGRNRI